ncbi:MAG: outer membrane protein assembly factor BamE [Rhodospirillaceae bacterium]|nr:outer membrane protein assembly factor BamE [Rhodospirillaceae bacterium]MBL6941420.1 outer membrane protein assembly factor BamE [Rhodospirillales bacterium]
MLISKPSKLLFTFGLLVLLGACTPKIDVRGNLPDPERLSEIVPGEQSRAEIEEILGTPSSVAVFDQETWLYVSQRTETVAFFEPEVKERKVIILKFDKDGIVSTIETLSAENGKNIQPVDRTTPTAGNEFTLIDQLFGNLGRFN